MLKDLFWYFQCRFVRKHQHHIIRTKLKPGWHDTDERILHACMSLLVEFVEKESSEKLNDSDEYKTMMEIYDWWVEERNNDLINLEYLYAQLPSREKIIASRDNNNTNKTIIYMFGERTPEEQEVIDQIHKLEQKIEDDENKMLMRLMSIRTWLWT